MKKKIFGILASVALLTACGSSLDHGDVKDKRFVPAHEESGFYYQCMAFDPKTGGCTMNMPMPYTNYYGDAWSLYLMSCEKPDYCDTDWIGVSKETYDLYAVGEYFPKEK